jgi:hypothetical protein
MRKKRSSFLWLMPGFLLPVLTVNAQDLIFKTGFEGKKDINFAPVALSLCVSVFTV